LLARTRWDLPDASSSNWPHDPVESAKQPPQSLDT